MAKETAPFDPNAYLGEAGGFDPDEYLRGSQSAASKVANLVGDIGTEASVSMAGQALGAATGPGYAVIAPTAGLYGNYLKQQREISRGDRKGYSLGEGIASAFLNLIPGQSIAKSTVQTVAKKTGEEIAKGIVKQAAVGAPATMVGGQIETAIEEKRFPTYDEYLTLAKSGAITGAIAGAGEGMIAGAELSKEAKGLWKRLAGKSEQELVETIGQIRESGSAAERKAASEIIDEVGQRMGLVNPRPKSAQESAAQLATAVEPRVAGTAEESARTLLGEGAVEMAKKQAPMLTAQEQAALRTRQAVEQARLQAEAQAQGAAAVRGGFGSEGAMAGSQPAPVSAIPGTAVSPRPAGGFGGSGVEGTPVAYPRSAAESALAFQNAVAAESPQTAAVFERAIAEGQTQAGAQGLRARLAAEQQASIRAGDFQRARGLEDIARQIEANRLVSPEQVPSRAAIEGSMVKPAGKVGRTLRTDMPTTEDIVQEFQTVPGVKGRAGVRELGLASAGGGVGLAAADMAAGKNAPAEGDIGIVELEHPYLGILRYTPDWSKEEIQKDLQQKEIEYQKIQLASPQLDLREKFEAATTPAEKLSVLQEFGPVGAAMGVRMAGGAAAGYAPPIARPFIGMGTEATALALEDKPITAGKMGRAAAEYTVSGKSGELAKNALKFLGINVAGEQIEEFIDRGGAITLDAAARRAAEGGGQALLMKALDKGKLAAAQKSAISKSDGELIRTLTLANEGGLVIDPVMFSRTAGRQAAMKVAGGSQEFHNYASIVNEPRVLKLAKEDIGIDGTLSDLAFTVRRIQLGEAYRDVAKVSPAAEASVNEWRKMNDLARDAYRKVQSKADTEALDAARVYKQKANEAFDAIVAEAEKLPNGEDLILRLRAAQKQIAKTYAVEAATNTATGRIDNAQVWGFMWDQKVPFDGNMETLARVARSMPQVMADTSKISIGKTLPQGKLSAAVAMTGVPAAARMAMGSGPSQALTFLPSYRQGTPDVAARASRFLVSDVSERMEPQRPIPYR